MKRSKIQQTFDFSYTECSEKYHLSYVQKKAARCIIDCKTEKLGFNVSICDDCGYVKVHNNSCRNRNCPNCQAVNKEIWVDKRRSEVIDTPYFHAVFTVPDSLNALIYSNQSLLYSLMHRCSSKTILELSSNEKYLGATPSIIQVLHTWGQKLNYHPHIHCVISGGGLTRDKKLKVSGKSFFIPVKAMGRLFKGKFLAELKLLYQQDKLVIPASCKELLSISAWKEFVDSLYSIDWCPYIKETFNGFGNAIDYLGRYTHRIAITNSRIKLVTKTSVTFSAKDYRTGKTSDVTLSNVEFIRRLLMHVLPSGFMRIRYYGLLSNRFKKINLQMIFSQQSKKQFQSLLQDLTIPEILKKVWKYDIYRCPCCGNSALKRAEKNYQYKLE